MRILRDSWYMFGWADEFGSGGVRRVIAEEPIRVERTGPDRWIGRSEAAEGRPIAVVLKHRIVWIWLGDADANTASTIADFSCFDDIKETAFFCGALPTAANYELLSDNILDLSHADFLHPATLGGGAMTRSPPVLTRDGATLTVTWEAPNDVALPVFDRMLPQPGQPAHVRLQVRWSPPATMLLRAQVAPAGEPLEDWFETKAAHIMTPQTEFTTHYFYGAVRNYREDDAAFNAMQAKVIGHAFAMEDKPLIEAQQQAMGQSDLWSLKPVLLSIDIGAVQARRTLARLIDQAVEPARPAA